MKLIFSVLFMFMVFLVNGQEALERRKISPEISMKLPESFIDMPTSVRIIKYVSDREPIAIFTNQDQTVDIGVNVNSTRWGPSDIPILKDFYKSSIQNLYSETTFIQEEIKKVGDRDFIVFEFVGKVYDENSILNKALTQYIYIQYTLVNEKVLLFNFSAPARYKDYWQKTANEVMNSVRLNIK